MSCCPHPVPLALLNAFVSAGKEDTHAVVAAIAIGEVAGGSGAGATGRDGVLLAVGQ